MRVWYELMRIFGEDEECCRRCHQRDNLHPFIIIPRALTHTHTSGDRSCGVCGGSGSDSGWDSSEIETALSVDSSSGTWTAFHSLIYLIHVCMSVVGVVVRKMSLLVVSLSLLFVDLVSFSSSSSCCHSSSSLLFLLFGLDGITNRLSCFLLSSYSSLLSLL